MDAVSELLTHVARLTKVSVELRQELRHRVKIQNVDKGRFLHQAGSVCNRTFFITQGLLRSYYCKGEKDITDCFAAEGEWITATDSFMRNEPDDSYLQALERSQVCSLTNVELASLFERFPEMERFGRIIISQQFMQQSARLAALRFNSAKDKCAVFCAAYRPVLAACHWAWWHPT
ncbi:MAG TPA: cyclic nucleotide-binding domain-containing protein [Hymenobacter sp.]|jgi:CRP-like cAMP-binding protein|uniref:Crp/Fnr family transcriptional regulator n=1 Tax=Hymenobacter sp. TaxID=1898978 RepID=UPI002ED7B86D